MPHVTLKEKGWKNFTGMFGPVEFENGRSVENLTNMEAERLGAITPVETDDGENPSPAQKQLDSKSYRASVGPSARKMTEEESKASAESHRKSVQDAKDLERGITKVDEETEIVDDEVEVVDVLDAPLDIVDAPVVADGYTRSELEKIADKQGLPGLRTVGDEFEVKSNSIGGLIDNILKAQESK